jgi:hypothetical protein
MYAIAKYKNGVEVYIDQFGILTPDADRAIKFEDEHTALHYCNQMNGYYVKKINYENNA